MTPEELRRISHNLLTFTPLEREAIRALPRYIGVSFDSFYRCGMVEVSEAHRDCVLTDIGREYQRLLGRFSFEVYVP